MASPIRIVIVDPYPIFRQGVVRTIARSGEMVLAAEGATANDARRLVHEKKPDVLILDIAVPGGLEAVREIARSGVKCAALTALDDVLSVSNALAAGVTGYILKGINGLELIEAVTAIHGNEPYVTAELALRLLLGAKGGALVALRDAKAQVALSRRERQLLEHVSQGLTNKEIAEELGLTIGTTKYYLTQLFRKLHVRNRLQAIEAARREGSI